MAYKGNGWVWMLFLAFMDVCYLLHVEDNSLNFFLKQPNVTISCHGLNYVSLTWDPEVIDEKVEFDICYYFSLQFLDKTNSITEKLTEHYRTIKLGLHPGFIAYIANALCKDNVIIIQSNQTEIVYKAPHVYINNVSCAIYNLTNLNCTWNLTKDAPDDTNYSFALRLSSKWLACKQYLKKQGKKIGCHMKDLLSKYDKHGILPYKIKIRFSNNEFNLSRTFKTEMIEILNPPINISVSSENGNTKINWYTPPSVKSTASNCFQYQIMVIETPTNLLFKDITDIEKEEYTFSDLDKDKKYSVQIRTRKKYCSKSMYWGEWSKPVFIGRHKEVFPTWILIVIIVIVSALLVLLVLFLSKRYTKTLFATTIPDPSNKIKLWMSSNDINSQRCIAVHNEQSAPITEIEIVTTSRDC